MAIYGASYAEETSTPVFINLGSGKNTEERTEDITIGNGSKIGYLNDANQFANPNAGTTNYSNSLYLTGDLTINGKGEVYITGKQDGTKYSALRVNGTVTVNGSDNSFINLKASNAQFKDLNITGGKVELHTGGTDFSQGNSYLGGDFDKTSTYNFSGTPKSSQIINSLTISGGHLKMGCDSEKNSYINGVLNSQGRVVMHYTNSFGSRSTAMTLTQNNGTMQVYGDSIAKDGMKINQYGGTLLLRDILHFNEKTENIFTQGQSSADNKPSLTFGLFTGNSATITLNQTGAGDINLAYGSNFKSSGTININQEGNGNIDIGGGHKDGVTLTNTYSDKFPGFLSTNTTYNIEQTGTGTITIKSGATITAGTVSIGGGSTLDVKGTMTVTGTSTLNGNIIVADGATFNLNGSATVSGEGSLQGSNVNINGAVTFEDTADLTVSSTISMSSGNSMTFSIGGTTEEHAAMTMTETGDLELEGGTLKLELTDVALQEMIDGATEEGTEYTLTLIDNISDTDVAQLQAAIDGGNLTLEDYQWSTVNTFAMRSATPNVTIESTGLVLENNALKAVMKATAQSVPEPATATLSLLALAGLAMRRRRK